MRQRVKNINKAPRRYSVRGVYLFTPEQARVLHLLSFVPDFMEGKRESLASVARVAIEHLARDLRPLLDALEEIDENLDEKSYRREAFVAALRYRPLIVRAKGES